MGRVQDMSTPTPPSTRPSSKRQRRSKDPGGTPSTAKTSATAVENSGTKAAKPENKVEVNSAPSLPQTNQDFCDCCKIGGTLICCERCPLAFHFYCCEPPLHPDDLPEGEWLCSMCRPRTLPEPKEPIQEEYAKIVQRFLQSNPTQFFPPERVARAENYQVFKKKARLGVPRDTLCYKCSKSVRNSEMRNWVQCDQCPIVYHADCLPKPLAAIPKIWRCPHHYEHYMPRRNRKRVIPFQEHKEPEFDLDEDALQLKFIEKIHKERKMRAKVQMVESEGKVTAGEKQLFLKSLLEMHESYAEQLGDVEASGQAPENTELVPVPVALQLDVNQMTDSQLRASVLTLRNLLENSTESHKMDSKNDDDRQDFISQRVVYRENSLLTSAGSSCVAHFRCSRTGEIFFVQKEKPFTFGVNMEGVPVDVDLVELDAPLRSAEKCACVEYNTERGQAEIICLSTSIWVNGVECTSKSKNATILVNHSVVEVCGLKFAFAYF
eukprot:m.107284 g.107284  ORF g.107284 m.107284 type:complete len:493 (-) comp13921_c1_seq6:63-1541(-)